MDIMTALSSRGGEAHGNEVHFLCPVHDDHTPSAYYNTQTEVWYCHSCGAKGNRKDLSLRLRDVGLDVDLPEPRKNGVPQIVATYDYVDTNGNLLYQVVRKEPGKNGKPKDFLQRRQVGGKWVWDMKGVNYTLYRLPNLLKGITERKVVFIVEGEKDADRLSELNCVATCNTGGAGKWRKSYAQYFKDARVVVVQDNDKAGAEHALTVAASLAGIAAEVRILPPLGNAKGYDISDWILSGNGVQELKNLIRDTPIFNPESIPETERLTLKDERPKVVLKGDLHQQCMVLLSALKATNNPPHIFQRDRELVRVVHIKDSYKDMCKLETLNIALLRAHVSSRFFLFEEKDGEEKPKSSISKDLAEMMLSQESFDFPRLWNIVQNPTFSRSGKLVIERGYNAETEMYVHFGSLLKDVPPLASSPSPEEVECAVDLILNDLLRDFPFTDEASRAHAVALGLLPFTRFMITGPTPLHMITAPTPGTGKSMLAEVLGLVSTGKEVEAVGETESNDEWRKLITSLLQEGEPFILLDNLNRKVDTSTLASAITSTIWKDRRLGTNSTIRVPNHATWCMTANNPTLSSEISRRGCWIHLDPKVEQPWRRSGFKHNPLKPWVKESRGILVWAFCTLVQNWVAKGKPTPNSEVLGSFEDWSHVIGGILQSANISGFLGNIDKLYERTDSESLEWRDFVEAWSENFSDRPVGVGELYDLAQSESLLPYILSVGLEKGQRLKLGKALTARLDRTILNFKIVEASRDTVKKANRYALKNADFIDGNTGNQKPLPVPLPVRQSTLLDDIKVHSTGNTGNKSHLYAREKNQEDFYI